MELVEKTAETKVAEREQSCSSSDHCAVLIIVQSWSCQTQDTENRLQSTESLEVNVKSLGECSLLLMLNSKLQHFKLQGSQALIT